ncbi:hypothetical protein HZB78_05490 [Candidatus Collierbacteria bacterium]|nr:hypothetical protein [Candidatus Collierbacteria bacterium]
MTQPKSRALTMGSFERIGSPGSFGHYFTTMLPDGREVCLESCLNGYDVAVYRNKELIGKKVCTDIEGMLEMQIMPGFSIGTGEALEKAIKIANKMI